MPALWSRCCSANGSVASLRRSRDGLDAAADPDHALPQDIGPQAAAVHEGAQHGARCVALDHHAGLAEPHAAAEHLSDLELPTDQSIQVDAPRNQVAPVLVRPERRLERRAHLRFDQRERAAGQPGGEGAAASDVAIAFQPLPRQGAYGADCLRGLARGRRDPDRIHGARGPRGGGTRRKRQDDVGCGDQVPRFDPVLRDLALAPGIPNDTGWHTVHDDAAMLAAWRCDPRDPGAGPGEGARIGDGGEAEPKAAEPAGDGRAARCVFPTPKPRQICDGPLQYRRETREERSCHERSGAIGHPGFLHANASSRPAAQGRVRCAGSRQSIVPLH